jgi:hypothetical protein
MVTGPAGAGVAVTTWLTIWVTTWVTTAVCTTGVALEPQAVRTTTSMSIKLVKNVNFDRLNMLFSLFFQIRVSGNTKKRERTLELILPAHLL